MPPFATLRVLLRVILCAAMAGIGPAQTGSTQTGSTRPGSTPGPARGRPAKTASAARVLFVGNSYTFCHEMPLMFAAIGAAMNPPRPIEVRMLAPARWTLREHWEQEGDDAPRTVLKQGRWDFVVLQEQSQLPFMKPEETLDYAARFAAEIAAVGAKPVFFMTWARRYEDFRQAQIAETYEEAATAAEGLLAPVGRAWAHALEGAKDLKLHDTDGSHPDPRGAWLTAAVLYATMFGGDPKTFPPCLRTQDRDVSRTLVELKPHEAATLRAAVAAVVTPQQASTTPKQPKGRRQTAH